MTLQELLKNAEKTLRVAGVEVPERTARWLWQAVSGMGTAEQLVHAKDPVPAAIRETYWQWVQRRANREPLQYVLGETEFCGLPFFVDRRVLIPRPETEQLVDLAMQLITTRIAKKNEVTVVDVGTGSGAVIVALAKFLQGSAIPLRFLATDISQDALDVAIQNAKRHQVDSSIQFVKGEYLNGVMLAAHSVDVIVSNPPYIPVGTPLQPEVEEWEPHIALYAEQQGLACYRGLAQAAQQYVAEDGCLAVELGVGQADAVQQIFRAADPSFVLHVVSDFRGIDRFVIADRGKWTP